ncbi:ecdysone-induced protein 74EF-like [Photinus pyralis]|uniref:ecdysone-induced protein 74EF-like n=1 Tax=Photinus pyralis TaxID=7054 RepID=UPI00126731A0|nr:ecdysone-induced protein 74EF-like [Photinus pyralis]
MSLAMPFIDNDLLWCPDNDGKMVDLSSCLQDAASVAIGQQNGATAAGGLGELSQSDLTSLVPGLSDEQEHIPDTEDIFKQLGDTNFELDHLFTEFNPGDIKQEENNNVPNSNTEHKSAPVDRRSTIKFTIAAANPLLAEKLATPSGQTLQLNTYDGRHEVAPLTPKVEKGRKCANFLTILKIVPFLREQCLL